MVCPLQNGLEIIQTLLPTIRFGQTNWAHLVGHDNNYRIIHKHQCLPVVTEIPWCPLVNEGDIEITGFVYASDRHGIWNGMEVDVFMAWDVSYTNYLQQVMAAYRLLMERNVEHLAYRAIGHVVRNGTSEICGLITEPAYGRIFEYSDKSAVYKAIAQIERAGLLFTGIHTSNIMITDDGQVRLLSLCALMRQSDDPVKRAEDVENFHWKPLEEIFKDLKLHPNPIPPPRQQKRQLLSLPEFPAPAYGPHINVLLVFIYHHPDPPPEYIKEEEDVKVRAVEKCHNDKGTLEMLVFDAPLSVGSLRAPRTRLHARATVPYRKPNKLMQELLHAQSWQQTLRYNVQFDS
ncbi:hypothetical protein MVEN_00313500 [Mycena venus]|uniref:Uncharacterized protein n=1 Tax=Mycena venus TaxID=2733690 RepID=A0A8H6Z2L8_9AGAR|nr:hypothetical protein MVEN_00313500 [Mycena venus]